MIKYLLSKLSQIIMIKKKFFYASVKFLRYFFVFDMGWKSKKFSFQKYEKFVYLKILRWRAFNLLKVFLYSMHSYSYLFAYEFLFSKHLFEWRKKSSDYSLFLSSLSICVNILICIFVIFFHEKVLSDHKEDGSSDKKSWLFFLVFRFK